MLRYLCKCKWQTLINSEQICMTFQKLQSLRSIYSGIRPITTSTTTLTTDEHRSFTVSYLKNSCGLSGKSLIYASKRVRFESSKRPNSVLELFQSFGISQTQFKSIIARHPSLLVADAQQFLKPKADFLLSLGISDADLITIITGDPYVLTRSIKNHLIPLFNLLKTLMGSEQNVVAAIKCKPSIFRYNLSKRLVPNLSLLQTLGLPQSQISKFINDYTGVINRRPDRFRKAVSLVMEMGFDPSSSFFIFAVKAMTLDRNRDGKFENYRSFGFSDGEILSMFKKQPICMLSSSEKIRRAVEFYVNKLLWSPSRLSIRPSVLLYSLEKRIIPRCSVLQALVSRNRIGKRVMVLSILIMTEKNFLQKYVTKYEDEVPEVLDAYQGKLKFDEYNFDSEGTEKAMAL